MLPPGNDDVAVDDRLCAAERRVQQSLSVSVCSRCLGKPGADGSLLLGERTGG
jgi:hypothetical protein